MFYRYKPRDLLFIIPAILVLILGLGAIINNHHQHIYQLEAHNDLTDEIHISDYNLSLSDCLSTLKEHRALWGTNITFHCTLDLKDEHYEELTRYDPFYESN